MSGSPLTKTAYLIGWLVAVGDDLMLDKIGVYSESNPTGNLRWAPVRLAEYTVYPNSGETYGDAKRHLLSAARSLYAHQPRILELLPPEDA